MTLRIAEWFGHHPLDDSSSALSCRDERRCPFIEATCTKRFNDKTISGVCSIQTGSGDPIPICPNRLYAGNYGFLDAIAGLAFGGTYKVIRPKDLRSSDLSDTQVVAFGQKFGSELKLPKRGGKGAYSVDWILAKLKAGGDLAEFVAVEVQTIDTTGSYKPEVESLRAGGKAVGPSNAGLNWENVNKRILPQLIYKGHVLRREPLCTKGLFFICPEAVHLRIQERLGGSMYRYENLQPGSIVFQWYSLRNGTTGLDLVYVGQFPTTVDQVATAFTSPTNLPEVGVYEGAIRKAIQHYR